jgi:hypothetical protein
MREDAISVDMGIRWALEALHDLRMIVMRQCSLGLMDFLAKAARRCSTESFGKRHIAHVFALERR